MFIFEISKNIIYENFDYDYHKLDTWEWTIMLVPHALSILKILLDSYNITPLLQI